ncbi:fungal specific transcription factor domain-containing protein [Metarhizium brunneum]
MAIPLFREAVDSPTEKNCDAIVAFAYFLVVYCFATDGETSHNSLLLINDDVAGEGKATLVIPQWLHFIRAGCCMLCDVWKRIENGPVSMLAMAWEVEMDVGDGELPYLDHFLAIIPKDSSSSANTIEVYRSSAVNLAKSFAYMYKVGMDSGVSTWSILGMWPVSVDTGYVDLLYAGDIKGGFWDRVGPLSSVFADGVTENKRNHKAKSVDARELMSGDLVLMA